ncbi:MAG: L-aspartate oxidase [Gemmatimonadales bacterium]|nr:L-aspartate oxidase [Gemmatimonadales bacterium]MDQ3426495.1 L-aspartate oxidase [Gemmatimonadota bacterium]
MTYPRPVIVGTGIAGLWTAWRLASEGQPAVVVTKETLADSASSWAQGGIAVALGPGDSPSQHAADTLAASDGLADPEAVRILTSEGPDRVYELLALGARFDRGQDGRLRLGLEAAHTRARIIHAGGDRTGAALIGCLAQVIRCHPQIELLEHTEVTALLGNEGGVSGVAALPREEAAYPIPAAAVVLATGGVGQLYAVTTNPRVATADGWALAYRAGALLRDIEFLQFHPTALRLPGVNPAPLISEAVRGAGALLLDREGHRFALEADPRGELAPRDILARAVALADARGGAWLDARGLADFAGQFPGITGMLARYGLDPSRDLLPVAPALHYAMGGVQTDLEGRSTWPGLWAAGEVASTGVHGANRLASNSLLEGLVFADRVGRALAAELRQRPLPAPAALDVPPDRDTGADPLCEAIRGEMREVMTADVGVQRTEGSLLHAEQELARLTRETPPAAWRTVNQLLVARLITQAARRRRESRGGHRRLDYPPPTLEREAV